MDNNKSQIEIPIPDPGKTSDLTAEAVKKEADSKFKDINYLLLAVVVILLVMVATLVIDSFHFNSATYKEYSQKEDIIERMQKINQELLDQNKKNQQIIIEQQKQIWRLIEKK